MPKPRTLIFIKSVFLCPERQRCRLYGARCLECFLETQKKAFDDLTVDIKDKEDFVNKFGGEANDDETLVKEVLDSQTEEPWAIAAFHLPVMQG